MKRTLSLLLSLLLPLALLPACGRSAGDPPAPESEEPATAARELAEAAFAFSGCGEELNTECLNKDEAPDRLAAYIEAVCGLTGDQWEDAAVIRGMGASAFEVIVLRLGDEAAAGELETVLTDYLTVREGAFTGYAPDEAALVKDGVVCRRGLYAGLFICQEPEAARDLFLSILETGEIPEPPQKPEPEPVQTPVPDLEHIVDMDSLAEALRSYCKDEIDEITAAGGIVASASPQYTDGFADTVEQSYGIPRDQWEDGFIINSLTGLSDFELVVFRMMDKDAAAEYKDGLKDYKDAVKARHSELVDGAVVVSEENAEQYMYVSGSHLVSDGEYLALFICRDAAAVCDFFSEAINSMLCADSPPSAAQPAADPQGVEIADGVYVTEVNWKEPEGEPDPDHPGRLLYTPTGNELMEVYDTSAIVSAWEKKDPSGLSDYDRAIYDNAKEALEEVLRDGMSDFEKEVEIYDWVLRNVDYDGSYMDVLEETVRDAYTPYGGLVNRGAVCLGYATTFQLLMELAGVECITVVGVGHSTEDHGWNMVRLNGQWYCADATWDWSFHLSDMIDGRETNGREWRFFNTTSDYMARTNHQWDYDAVPEATAEDYGSPAQ